MAFRERKLAVWRAADCDWDGIWICRAPARTVRAGAGRDGLSRVGVLLRAALGTGVVGALLAILKALRRAVAYGRLRAGSDWVCALPAWRSVRSRGSVF